jgi:Flp pilus assembly protein TadG
MHAAGRRRGSALIEFALMSPVMLLLLAGVLDYGRALRVASAVANAARVGAQYGSRSSSNSSDTAGMQSAARNTAPDITGMTVNASRYCQCTNGSAVSCTGTCGTGKVQIYVQVNASATASPIFDYTALGFTGVTASRATMRAQ